MLCGQQVLPSTYRDLHSHRSCLPWEETINRDAKHSTKNPNLSIGSVRLCVFCQRKVLAQCRGRCCRQHLLGGLPISATIQPFNVCKDLAQEQFLSAFPAVTLLTPAHLGLLPSRAVTELPSSHHTGVYQCSPTLLPNLLNFFLPVGKCCDKEVDSSFICLYSQFYSILMLMAVRKHRQVYNSRESI